MIVTASRAPLAGALALAVLVIAEGCGDPTPCDQALDKVKSCGIADAKLTTAGDQCQTYAACAAQCVLKAGCNDVRATYAGDTQNALGACVEVCGQ